MQPPEAQASKLDRQAEKLSAKLAESTTRLSFLGRLSAAALAIAGGSAVAAAVKPDEAEAFHFCGHIWTTNSCPSPYPPLSRIDRKGYPKEQVPSIQTITTKLNRLGFRLRPVTKCKPQKS